MFPLGAALAGDPYSAYARSFQTATDQAGQQIAGNALQQMFNVPMPGAQQMPSQGQAPGQIPPPQQGGFLTRLFGGQQQAPGMPPSGAPAMPMSGGAPQGQPQMRPQPPQGMPQQGGGQNPIGSMTFPQIVQGLVRSNPGAAPAQIFSALRQMAPAMVPFMNADALAQYRAVMESQGQQRIDVAREGQQQRAQTAAAGQDIRQQSLQLRILQQEEARIDNEELNSQITTEDAQQQRDAIRQQKAGLLAQGRQQQSRGPGAPQGQTWSPQPRPGYGPPPPQAAPPQAATPPPQVAPPQAAAPPPQVAPPPQAAPPQAAAPPPATSVVPQTSALPPGVTTVRPPQAGAGVLGQALAQRAAQLRGGQPPQAAPGPPPRAPAPASAAPPPQAATPAPVRTASAAPEAPQMATPEGTLVAWQPKTMAGKQHPDTVKAIAEYRMRPPYIGTKNLANRQIMDDVQSYSQAVLGEKYDDAQYNARKGTESQFASGVPSRRITAINAVVGHFDVLNDAAKVLEETMKGKQMGVSGVPGAGIVADTPILRRISAELARQFGWTGPFGFDAVKTIVADEVVKAIVINGGGVTDRQEAKNLINIAQSPPQLQEVIGRYKELMGGQAVALRQAYKAGGGKKDFDKEFLTPETRAAITVPRKANNKPETPSYGGPQE